MILSKISQLGQYKGINVNLDTAIEYLLNNDITILPLGKNVVNENVAVMHFNYVADNQVDDFYEGHRAYLDMHIVLSGKEKMSCVDITNATMRGDFDVENDFALFDGKSEFEVVLENNLCLITFPHDLHEPKVRVNDEPVDKIVVKVKL